MGLDVVLGVQWLENLGIVTCDWKKLTMVFQWNNQRWLLYGLDAPPNQAASLEEISKKTSTADSVTANPGLQKLLTEFLGLFHEPNQLAPTRKILHHINLKEWSEPVNIRPYRYTYF